ALGRERGGQRPAGRATAAIGIRTGPRHTARNNPGLLRHPCRGGRGARAADVARAVADGHFFFQAEDGIRDRNVTGVQTCALPISEASNPTPYYSLRFGAFGSRHPHWGLELNYTHNKAILNTDRGAVFSGAWNGQPVRSEERRVGKECSSV